MYIYCLYIQ